MTRIVTPPISVTQRLVIDGLLADPAEFADFVADLDILTLGEYGWLSCVVAGLAGSLMNVQIGHKPDSTTRSDAYHEAHRLLVARYAPGQRWFE